MKLFMIAALLAVAVAAPTEMKEEIKEEKDSIYEITTVTSSQSDGDEMKEEKDYKYPEITVTNQSDERNLDGSSKWNYVQSDYTIREEAQEQKKFIFSKVDDYGNEIQEEIYGNTNKGSSYWISSEGEKFILTWVADENGFQPKGDHLPVAPVHEYELPVAPVHEYELPVAPVHEYELPVAPVHEYELPVAPVHIPFNGKGYKIY